MAKNVLAEHVVDEVWLLPCYKHMFGKNMTSPEHRFEMCKLAVSSFSKIKASSLEIDHKFDGKAYDFVTQFLKNSFSPEKYQFKFIIGMDNALQIKKWYRWEDLLKEIGFIVFPRQNQKEFLINAWYEQPQHKYFPKPISDISSTQIRNWIQEYGINGMELAAPFINRKVLDYIKENKLYA